MSQAAWFNGAPADGPLAFARGLHYGDGIFRTLLNYNNQVIDLEGQIEKIAEDCRGLDLAAPEPALLRAEIGQAAAGTARCVLKVVVMRAGAGRGYRPQTRAADRLVLSYPVPAYPAACWDHGVAAFRCGLTLAEQPRLAGIKHLNRLEQVLAARDWPDGTDEGLLGTADGAPVCGTRSNLFWVREGRLQTPPLDRCGVAGRMRVRILALAASEGIPTAVAHGSWQELVEADEAFLSNSLIGIWPLRGLEQHRWPAPGPVTARLAAALQHPRLT